MLQKKNRFHPADLKTALCDTLPVMAGYVVLGMGFGMIMTANGFPLPFAAAMSIFIYAGSMQYALVGLITGGASLLTVALTTLAVNARHLFYGISMIDGYRNAGVRKPYMIFALTDETYSLVCSGGKSTDYQFFVSLFDHIWWVSGTVIGSLLGSVLPINTEGIDFALTALFLTVFTDQWLHSKEHLSALTGVVSSVLCLIVFGPDRFLIPSMILIAALLLLRRKFGGEHRE